MKPMNDPSSSNPPSSNPSSSVHEEQHSNLPVDKQEKVLNCPIGFKFSPCATDLIQRYLFCWVMDRTLPLNVIRYIDDLFQYDPDQMPMDEGKLL